MVLPKMLYQVVFPRKRPLPHTLAVPHWTREVPLPAVLRVLVSPEVRGAREDDLRAAIWLGARVAFFPIIKSEFELFSVSWHESFHSKD